jgi:hypothetical protein
MTTVKFMIDKYFNNASLYKINMKFIAAHEA